jgi:hypothetical protein
MLQRREFLKPFVFAAIALILLESVSLAVGQNRTGAKPTEKAGQMNKEKMATKESPIMCVLGSLDAKQLERHQALRQQLKEQTKEVRELPDGYALRLPAENSMILSVAEFITLERQCCPFFSFAIEVEGDKGALWLKLTGRDGVKEFLKSQLEGR